MMLLPLLVLATVTPDLQKEREWLFERASHALNSGFELGAKGSTRDLFFPAGKADVLYFITFTVAAGGKESHTVTAWSREGGTAVRQWQVHFSPGYDHPQPSGTLLRFAAESAWGVCSKKIVPGSRPVKTGGWPRAKSQLERAMPLVHYHFGGPKDVVREAFVELIDTNGIVQVNEPLKGAGLRVLQAEQKPQ